MLPFTMANERAPQKKLERKRRKREEKRRTLRAATDSTAWAPPPMSPTLKAFAQPLLDRLPEGANADDWKLVLTFAGIVWDLPNAFWALPPSPGVTCATDGQRRRPGFRRLEGSLTYSHFGDGA
jgi:hypothetical protein